MPQLCSWSRALNKSSKAQGLYAAGLVVAALLDMGYATWDPACCCSMQVLSKLVLLIYQNALLLACALKAC